MEGSIKRDEFMHYEVPNSPGFKFFSSFSNSSLIMSLAIGILEIFARFKGGDLPRYISMLENALNSIANEAKNTYPSYAQHIDFYLGFAKSVKEMPNSVDAFKYLDYYTITEPSNYLSIISIAFKHILAHIYSNKPEYQNCLINDISVEKFRFNIIDKIVQSFALEIVIYDGSQKDNFKYLKLGDFPLLNLYTHNLFYYLIYTEDLFNDRYGTVSERIKKEQPFLASTRVQHTPINNPVPSQQIPNLRNPDNVPNQPPVQINYSDTNSVLRELVSKLSDELSKHNEYSKEFSDFVTICIRNNESVSSIPQLQRFVKPTSLNPVVRFVKDDSANDIIFTNSRIFNDSQTIQTKCSVCSNNRPPNYFANNSHVSCRVCKNCARNRNSCPKCNFGYSREDLESLV